MPYARFAAASAAALLAASPAFAGVVIEGTGEEGEENQRFLMDGQKLRFDTGSGADAMIFDASTKQMVHVDAANKTFTEFTKEDAAQVQAMSKGVQKEKSARTTRYEKTGKSDKALGKSCDVYRVIESDAEEGEEETICVAPFGTFGISRGDFAPFLAFGDFASQLSGGGVDRGWADLPGVPLIAWEKDDEGTRETFRATKVEKRSVPASEFAVPAGFKKGPGFAEQMREMQKAQQEMQQQLQQQLQQQQGGKK